MENLKKRTIIRILRVPRMTCNGSTDGTQASARQRMGLDYCPASAGASCAPAECAAPRELNFETLRTLLLVTAFHNLLLLFIVRFTVCYCLLLHVYCVFECFLAYLFCLLLMCLSRFKYVLVLFTTFYYVSLRCTTLLLRCTT